ncbi:alpha-N-acetylglucosaminidase C-terminal domain-containing protein [Streptomyces sp. KL116D]|uniref:alpha-N-acetylglucosaminidase C-terminal domain-containing protein n=1 Tax=Streptomyces sp. KL116D TaxID=3045152 RepID=UPI00355887B2
MHDGAERDRLAYDQLSLVTVWGTREGAEAGLHDYANREWAGSSAVSTASAGAAY